MKKLGIAVTTAWVIAAVLYLIAFPKWAGAHPFWANQVLFSGVILGTVLSIVAITITQRVPFITFSVASAIAFMIAAYGKKRFVASFAEDTFGGQLWYFGWHGFCVFGLAAIIAGIFLILPESDRKS